MLKDSGFSNLEYTYALCESGFHNLECIKEVIFWLNEYLWRKLKHNESLNNIYTIKNINLVQQHITNMQLKQHKTRD